mmetsp:Transcript_3069/g.9162  ORF Transcript_3069/g.9162 Transcript_3069/m.9162 type:complete len:315 (+) Transcript_3069:219-1163(+)
MRSRGRAATAAATSSNFCSPCDSARKGRSRSRRPRPAAKGAASSAPKSASMARALCADAAARRCSSVETQATLRVVRTSPSMDRVAAGPHRTPSSPAGRVNSAASVDLPAPLPPATSQCSPGATVQSTPRRIVVSPVVTPRPRASTNKSSPSKGGPRSRIRSATGATSARAVAASRRASRSSSAVRASVRAPSSVIQVSRVTSGRISEARCVTWRSCVRAASLADGMSLTRMSPQPRDICDSNFARAARDGASSPSKALSSTTRSGRAERARASSTLRISPVDTALTGLQRRGWRPNRTARYFDALVCSLPRAS